MNLGTPEGCRAEAKRHAILADEAKGDRKRYAKHIDLARELLRMARKLEDDEADPLPF